MKLQLRTYTINKGQLAQFTHDFNHKIKAARESVGFKVLGAWTVPATNQFVWIMGLEDGLRAIGESFLRALLAPESLAFFRIVVGEGRKFPHLLQGFIFASADRMRGVVVQHLRRAAPEIAAPDQIAGYFLEMLRSRQHYRALAEESFSLSDPELNAHVGGVVRFFVAGARAF